jgi:putative ABC transport system permease protein
VVTVALKGIAARKLRAASTMLAVLLGVALVSGTFILTDTINRSFDDIFETALEGTDVVVTPKEIVEQDTGEVPPMPAANLQKVEAVPGVAKAEGGIFSIVRITNAKGDTMGADFAPQFANSVSTKPFDTFTYVEGRPPANPREAAIDSSNADKENIDIGDTVGVAGDVRLTRYRVVGINRLGDTATGGSSTVTLTLPEAQRVAGKRGEFDQISVAADSGVSPDELKQRLQRALPSTVRVETGQASAERQSKDVKEDLNFLLIALLVFAGVSLVVGGFQIFNTFSITVAQRIREFGLLRTLGASRGQILRSVVVEALLIGFTGSILGLLAGFGFAKGINGLLTSFGIDLPNTGTVFLPRTVIVGLLVGVGITLVSSIAPALRATHVSPMEALREAALPEGHKRGRVATGVAVLLGVVGLGLLLYGLFGTFDSSGAAAGLMGGGSAAILFAASLFSPTLVRPLANLAGKPIEALRGITGRLARENAMRKPGRTATTAAALMIGLALVTFVTVFAAGISKSVGSVIEDNFQGDITIQATDGFSPIPNEIEPAVAKVQGVDAVSALRYSQAKVTGQNGKPRLTAVDPKNITKVFRFEWKDGGSDAIIRGLTDDQAVIDEVYGKKENLDIGDTIRVLTPAGRRHTFEVVGKVKDRTDFLGSFIVTQDALARYWREQRDNYVIAKYAPGANAEVTEGKVKAVVTKRFPSAEALNQQQLKKNQEDQINQLLGLIYALLSLAIIVSIFGIVNTLALSIHERTRELGMLRAIGMSRRQVRRVIRYEAVITALIGAILGMILGVLFAALISRPLADEGFELAYPIGTLILLLVLAALAGVLAAIGPARRASKLDVLDALAYE